MFNTKTLLDDSVAADYFKNKKIFVYNSSANGPDGLPFWGFVVFKVADELHILEAAFEADSRIKWVLGVVKY